LTIYVHHNANKIDFSLDVDKLSNGEQLVSGWDRQIKEGVFCALPLLVSDFQHHHELAGAVTQPGNKELQFEGSESAYYAIQHFADVSNEDLGITLSTVECPLVEYGYPRSRTWDDGGAAREEEIVKPINSSMFLYLMNNFFFTNISVDQSGKKHFTFAIRSHKGNWQKGQAYKFGWESSHPIISKFVSKNIEGTLAEEKAFLTVDKENVIYTTVKPAEANGSGYILRFFELEGKNTRAKVKLNFLDKISNAKYVSLIENDLGNLTVSNQNEISFDINGHGLKTIRVTKVPAKVKTLASLKAQPLSDVQINLEWAPVKKQDVSHYNIYRSHLHECKISRRNFIGTSEGLSYLDEPELNYGGWPNNYLEPDKNYYYRICPVDLYNNEGQSSNAVSCKTLLTSDKNAVPNKVLGVYTVHVSPLAPENDINIWFYTNVEVDVDKYMINRGITPDFVPNSSNLLHILVPSEKVIEFNGEYSNAELNRQMYNDVSAEINQKYFYKVCAVDDKGQKGEYSDPTEGIAKVKYNPITIFQIREDNLDFSKFSGIID